MKPCSMCGNKPAVCVDRMHKGTHWLCGDCAGERIEELIHLRARIEALEKLLAEDRGCGECWHGVSCGRDCHMNDVAALAAEPKLADLGGGLSSYENLGRNPPEERATLDAEEET